jgi:hypothetical protein
MKNFEFESARRFVVFSYSVGHGLLLLRSSKTNASPTRLDMLIQDVRVMEIRSSFDGIRIEEVNVEYLGKYSSRPAEMLEHGNRIYAMRGSGWSGFVVGGEIAIHEDEGDFMAPSFLMDSGF